jgi:hypothetical protein
MYLALKAFAREHPTIILTICYAIMTIIGTGYSFFFYREFDINIIKFADLSDFLLAAILEPLSLVLFTFLVLFNLLAYWLDTLLRKRFNGYRNFLENRLKSKYTDPLGMLIIIVVFSISTIHSLAVKNADIIKNQGKDKFQVRFNDSDRSDATKVFELLGSTSRFVYLYDQTNKQSVVISPENISYMSKSVTEKLKPANTTPIPKEAKQ